MGKDSLLESTSKKKPTAKGKAAKKIAAKKSKAAKTAIKTKAKPKSRPAPKTAAKSAKTPAKVKKAAAKKSPPAKKKPEKKLTAKELLFKKFEHQQPKALYSPPTTDQKAGAEAPSYFAGMSESVAATAKEALQRKFDWAEIKTAGKKYAAQLAAKAEEEAMRKAEEDAKRKAEEEAMRKALEEDAAAVPPTDSPVSGLGGNKPLKLGLIALGAVLLLLIMSSYNNTKKYFITEKDGVVSIQRGTFTPMGSTLLITMTDVQMPEPPQDIYNWQEAYRLMYQHYINEADKLLEAPGIPDTAALAAQLEQAVKHAPNRELRDAARSRLVGIRSQIFVHKAQAALNRRTIEGANAALEFLKEASYLDLSAGEEELVKQRMAEAERVLADLEAAKAEAERQAVEEAALEAEAQKLEDASANSAAADATPH